MSVDRKTETSHAESIITRVQSIQGGKVDVAKCHAPASRFRDYFNPVGRE